MSVPDLVAAADQDAIELVRESIALAKASLVEAAEQIIWQIENRAWEVLGYPGWDEMREAEYGGAAFMVPRAGRPELVSRMRRSGLTAQQIADTAGVDRRTVIRDLNVTNAHSEPPATITNSRGQERPAVYTKTPPGDVVEAAVTEFPDLGYYVDIGRARDAVNMAGDLRRYRERGELGDRLNTLRRSIDLDKSKRDGTYVPPALPTVCPTCGQPVKEK